MHSELGNDVLGLLSMTVIPAVYLTLVRVNFIALKNPGQTFSIPPNSTDPQMATINQAHKNLICIWKEYLGVDKALKQHLLGYINEILSYTT